MSQCGGDLDPGGLRILHRPEWFLSSATMLLTEDLWDKVVFGGFINQAELPNVYAAFDIFVRSRIWQFGTLRGLRKLSGVQDE